MPSIPGYLSVMCFVSLYIIQRGFDVSSPALQLLEENAQRFAEMDVDCVEKVTNVEEDEVFFMDDLQLKWAVDYWTSSKEGAPLETRRNTETFFHYVDLFIVDFVAACAAKS